MNKIRINITVYKSEELLSVKNFKGMSDTGWCYAFVDNGSGIYLCEVYGNGAWCYAEADIVDENLFNIILKQDPDFYLGANWHEYRSDVMGDLLIPEDEKDTK